MLMVRAMRPRTEKEKERKGLYKKPAFKEHDERVKMKQKKGLYAESAEKEGKKGHDSLVVHVAREGLDRIFAQARNDAARDIPAELELVAFLHAVLCTRGTACVTCVV